MTTTLHPILPEIEAFLVQRDMAPVTFGRLSLKDPHFVRDIRDGRRLWPQTEAKVRKFMASYDASSVASEREAA